MATLSLQELAAKSLLSNEAAAIHVLQELPKGLFVSLFTAAFSGGHTKVLKEMVRVWPFHCLHIGTLSREESYHDVLEAMIDGLQMVPAQNSSTCGPKLRILDLRQEQDCQTTCRHIKSTSPLCSQACIYSQHSVLKLGEAQHNVRCLSNVNSGSEPQSAWEPREILLDLCISDNLRKKQFLSFLQSKVEQSFGSLHLCCRGLHIDNMSADKSILQCLDLGCTEHLEVEEGNLSEFTPFFTEMTHLVTLSLSNISSTVCEERNFRAFLTWLGQQDNLQDLFMCSFCLRSQLHRLLRVLPPQLDTLYLSYCCLCKEDITALSQTSQASHLMQLTLSNNQIFLEDCEPFRTLLEKASGTLTHLEINNCLMTDSTLSAILPALSHCSRLRGLNLGSNPITMPVLRRLVQHLTSLMELKHVIYPVPLHCYEEQVFHGPLDEEKLAEVKAQLEEMLQVVQRDDMKGHF